MKKIVVIIAVTEKRIGLKNKKPEIKIANPTTKLLIINELKQKVKIDIINIIVIKIKKKYVFTMPPNLIRKFPQNFYIW